MSKLPFQKTTTTKKKQLPFLLPPRELIHLDQGGRHALTAICVHQKRQAAFRLFSASEQQAGKPPT